MDRTGNRNPNSINLIARAFLSGWDEGAVYYSDQAQFPPGSGHDSEAAPSSGHVFLTKFKEFIRNFQFQNPRFRTMELSDEEQSADTIAFMKLAFEQAKLALDSLEVPIGCVITEKGKVISSGRNRTTETRNATRHAEMEAIDSLLDQWKKDGLSPSEVAVRFSNCSLYVTCEPCIMCASALSFLGIKEVSYGCSNDKFGGCGSILSLHTVSSGSSSSNGKVKRGFKCTKGAMASEAVSLLRMFYEQGNPNAPKPHRQPLQHMQTTEN